MVISRLKNASKSSRRKRSSKRPERGNKRHHRLLFETLEDRRLLAASPPLLDTIEGFNIDENGFNANGSLIQPPDPYGAVGPSHILNVGNVSVQWFRKDGTPQVHTSLKNFFSPLYPVTSLFDPKVVYDQYNDRFVVLALEQMDTNLGDPANMSRIMLAVSDDANPNGNWYYHQINGQVNIDDITNPGTPLAYWTDYPGLAIDEEVIYVTGNLFEFGTNTPNGNRLWIVDKGEGTGGFYDGDAAESEMYDPAGDAGVDFTGIWNGAIGFRSMQPAHVFGDAPAGVGTWLAMYDGYNDGVDEFVDLVRVDDPLGTPTFTHHSVNVGDLEDVIASPLPLATQRDSTFPIDGGDRRTLNAVWRNDSLYVSTVIYPEQGPDVNQITAHWFRFDTTDPTETTLADQGDVGGEDIGFNVHTTWPAIMVDAEDNMAIAFSAMGPTLYPGSYYAVRAADDPAGTIRGTRTIAAGLDLYELDLGGNGFARWGDYASVALDPSDEVTFWAYQDYALPAQFLDGRWGTRWGKFRLGALPDVVGPGPTKISGVVWHDENENRRRDDLERGLGDWLVYIDSDGDGERDLGEPSVRTDSAGRYSFTVEEPGTYIIREAIKPGWTQTKPAGTDQSYTIVAEGDQMFSDIDFGNSDADGFDHGDAPSPYPTLESVNGPVHAIIPGFGLGTVTTGGPLIVDGEPDGLPDVDALGDDLDNEPDEAGVEFTSPLAPGISATVDVSVSLGGRSAGMLQAWVDFNQDGDWSDPGEQIFGNLLLGEGTHTLTFNVPAGAVPGATYARFRYAQESDLGFVGRAFSGEVEDYQVDILSDEPIAVDDQFTVDQDSTGNPLDVLANDVPSSSGIANLYLQSINMAGASGTAVISRNNTPNNYTDDFIVYNPAPGAFAPDSFTYTIEDVTTGATDSATVSITIEQTAGNVPVAVDDSYTVSISTQLNVLANDREGPNGPISIPANGLDTTGTAGSVILETANIGGVTTQVVRYTPAPSFSGSDQFDYTIVDANNVTDTATVTVHVPPHTADDVIRFRLEATDENGNLLPDNDNDGIPEIGQGLKFQLRAYVQDMRGQPGYPPLDAGLTPADQGVFSAYMDILYDAGLVAYSGPVTFDPEYAGGQFFDASVPGILNEVGAFQGAVSQPLGNGEFLLFAATYTASAQGVAEFKSDPADVLPLHETTLNFPAEPSIDFQRIEFMTTDVEIIESPDLVRIRLEATNLAGDPLTNNQLVAGQEFFVNAWVDDIRGRVDEGVFSAYLDVFYNPSLATPVPDLGNPLDIDITWGGLFNAGRKASAASPGIINESGAFQGDNAILFQNEELLYTIRFRALAPPGGGIGTLVFDADQADNLPLNETTLIEPFPGISVPPAQIDYVDTSPITVIASGGEGEFTNPDNPSDVNDDDYVTPLDALFLVSYLNRFGPTDLSALVSGAEGENGRYYFDTNSDMVISPADILTVIQELHRQEVAAVGEGEAIDGLSTLEVTAAPIVDRPVDYLPPVSAEASSAPRPLTVRPSTGEELAIWPDHDDSQETALSSLELHDDELTGLDQILTDDLAEDILAAWS